MSLVEFLACIFDEGSCIYIKELGKNGVQKLMPNIVLQQISRLMVILTLQFQCLFYIQDKFFPKLRYALAGLQQCQASIPSLLASLQNLIWATNPRLVISTNTTQ